MLFLYTLLLSICLANEKALVVLDMQPGFISRHGVEERPENVKILAELGRRQLELIGAFQARQLPIVLVETAGAGPTAAPLTTKTLNYSRLRRITKKTNSVLAEERARTFFRDERITELVLAGANGSACVAATANDALDLGFRVTAVRSTISDFDFETFWYPFTFRNFEGFRILFEKGLREVASPEDVFR